MGWNRCGWADSIYVTLAKQTFCIHQLSDQMEKNIKYLHIMKWKKHIECVGTKHCESIIYRKHYYVMLKMPKKMSAKLRDDKKILEFPKITAIYVIIILH